MTAKNGDDAILETYLKHRRITGYIEREAREVWALFKRLTDNKPLKNCDRDDGRKIVEYFEGIAVLARAQGILRSTMMARVRLASAPFQRDLQQARSSYPSLNTGRDIGFMGAVAICLIR